ncbi:MAG: Plug domain-containing protein [Gemmatimonadales bacterium]
MSALTTATGTVSLFFLPEGGSLVRLRKVGFDVRTLAVAISPADTLPLTVVMHRQVQQLAAMKVRDSATHYLSPFLRDAESRMKSHAGGYFIGESQMRKLDNSTLADAMRSRMPGLMSTAGKHGETQFVSSRSPCRSMGCRTPNCFVNVYLDGVPYPITDFSHASPQDFAIAEFYPGGASVPVEYSSSAMCGVLLLWSREK